MKKKHRQNIIKKIIKEKEIGDQIRLLAELKVNGIAATQATISRDFQEMGVIKSRVKLGVFRYEIVEKIPKGILWEKLKVLFANFVIDIKSTNNLLLIKTSPGNANGVANLIDCLEILHILGTVAGDDTILVVTDSEKSRRNIEKELLALLNAVVGG